MFSPLWMFLPFSFRFNLSYQSLPTTLLLLLFILFPFTNSSFFFFLNKNKTKQNKTKNKSHHNLFASFRFFPNFFHIDAILCKERLTGCELTQLCKTQYMLHDHVELSLGLYQIILINVITQDHEILRWHLDILPITWRERLLNLHI